MALAAVKGDRTLAQLAEQFHPNQITSWKAQLEGGAADVFGPGSGSRLAEPAIDVKSLHAKIGELTLENDFFRTPAAEYAARFLKRPASETLHRNRPCPRRRTEQLQCDQLWIGPGPCPSPITLNIPAVTILSRISGAACALVLNAHRNLMPRGSRAILWVAATGCKCRPEVCKDQTSQESASLAMW